MVASQCVSNVKPQQSFHPSSMSTFGMSVGPGAGALHHRPMMLRERENSRSMHPFSTSISVVSKAMAPVTTTRMGAVDIDLNKRFLMGVGWCIKSTPSGKSSEHDGVFTLLFLDGAVLNVFVKEHVLVWEEVGGVERRLKIERSLPGDIKRRLAHLPKFMKLF